MKKKLRIGILIDNEKSIDYFSYDIINWLNKNNNQFNIYLLKQNINQKSRLNQIFKLLIYFKWLTILNKIFYKLLLFIEYSIIKNDLYKSIYNKKINLKNLNLKLINLYSKKTKNNLLIEFDNKSISLVKGLKLDLILRFNSKILRGKILNISKNGIISFHHGDNDYFRGGPAGFWEIYNEMNKTGFIIQKLTRNLDNGKIIFKGWFKTENYFLLNQINVKFRSNEYLKKILNDFYKFRSFNYLKKRKLKSRIYKNPNFFQVFKYFFKIALRRSFKKNYEPWNIAAFKGPPSKVIHNKSIKFNKEKNFFYADPFIISNNNENYIFTEKFDLKKKGGKIVVLKIENGKLNEIGDAIVEKFHLSYPFVFQINKKFYLIPDSSSNKDIRVYISNSFPLGWRLLKVIKKNIYATDTTLIKNKNSWYIFTNINNSNFGDLNSELHIFFSNNPITKQWKAFKNNPIILDPDLARNGGFIKYGKTINRVYQKHNFNDYGNCIGIDFIYKRKPNFISMKKRNIKLKYLNQLSKSHHLNFNGQWTVYDYT